MRINLIKYSLKAKYVKEESIIEGAVVESNEEIKVIFIGGFETTERLGE